jgi:hypothetical protein
LTFTSDVRLRTRLGLAVQRAVGRLLSIFWIPATAFAMHVVMRYRIPNASKLRRRFRRLVKESDEPILICANHLTMVDSAVVAWALGGSWWYLFNYRWMPWNLPEYRNYAGKWFNRVGVWILKCIPIRRGGRREEVSATLKRIQYLLSRGETAIIFAEGGRSRTGRVQVESIAHGMGRIVNSVRKCRALCVYLRGERQLDPLRNAAVARLRQPDRRATRPYGREVLCSSEMMSLISSTPRINRGPSTHASTNESSRR